MSNNRHIIFLFLCIFQISLSDSTNQKESSPKQIPLCVQDLPDMPDSVHEDINKQRSRQSFESAEKTNNLSQKEIDELESIFESSPKKAQTIINHLQDPTYLPPIADYRSVFFIGEPGTGKTMMAKAIAYKMAQHGWKSKYLVSTKLLGEYRNHTALNLKKELEAAVSSGKPTIVIIDHLNLLLENTQSKNHDTDITESALWAFLDKQKRNKNFFFIGIMDQKCVPKLSKYSKSRMRFDLIKFELI